MPVAKSSQTISDALHTATMLLSRSSPSARLDAELLLEYVTGLSRTSFRAMPERELPVNAGWSFQQLVKRRAQGEPVAYIRQQQEFWSLLLEVSPAVLIPRPETELVVERALAHIDMNEPGAQSPIWAPAAAPSQSQSRRNVRTPMSLPWTPPRRRWKLPAATLAACSWQMFPYYKVVGSRRSPGSASR